jgi:hypothetical protein
MGVDWATTDWLVASRVGQALPPAKVLLNLRKAESYATWLKPVRARTVCYYDYKCA